MLPLSPPPGYFKEINSIISKFIWNDKCPRIKLTTLQHPNSAGGLAVPNFELYYWSFQLKAFHNWVQNQNQKELYCQVCLHTRGICLGVRSFQYRNNTVQTDNSANRDNI